MQIFPIILPNFKSQTIPNKYKIKFKNEFTYMKNIIDLTKEYKINQETKNIYIRTYNNIIHKNLIPQFENFIFRKIKEGVIIKKEFLNTHSDTIQYMSYRKKSIESINDKIEKLKLTDYNLINIDDLIGIKICCDQNNIQLLNQQLTNFFKSNRNITTIRIENNYHPTKIIKDGSIAFKLIFFGILPVEIRLQTINNLYSARFGTNGFPGYLKHKIKE
jgi:virulence-associated protein VapD